MNPLMTLLLVAIWAVCISGGAMASGDFGIPLNHKKPITPDSLIKVKIFPHTVNYPPHGKDVDTRSVTLRSSKTCRQYKGDPGRAARIGKEQKRGKIFQFNYNQMVSAVYLRCSGRVTVDRAQLTDYSYLGSFYIRKVDGHIEVVNLVSLKQYLRGVVPSEVYSHWPAETLKTQAVAARSYAAFHLANARRMKRRYFDVDDTVQYQAYTGVSHITRKTDRAVAETKGVILTYNDRIIQAYYHADSGGKTEGSGAVWGKDIPYLQAKNETITGEALQKEWSVKLSLKNLQAKLRNRRLIRSRQRLKSLFVPAVGRSDSGRVKLVTLDLGGSYKNISIREFRKLLGKGVLPSTLFTFEKKGRSLMLKGLGSGHGVGMSQRGAAQLAQEKGWSHSEILSFYYTGATICQLGTDPHISVESCYKYQKANRSRIFTDHVDPSTKKRPNL